MDKLQKSLFEFNDSLEKAYPIIPGEIGISLGGSRITEVPGRGQFVYVRLRSNQSEIIQVYNGKVFPGYGVPVLVQWNNNRYEIIGVDVQRYQQWLADNPIIAKHGATHSMDKEGDKLGTDPVWVYPYQFMPSLVSPFPQSGILNAYINPLMVQYGGQWRYLGNTGTSSLTAYNPVSGSSIVLISLDASTGNPSLYATTGTYIPSSTTGTNDLLAYLPNLDLTRYIPLSFILLASGTSGITWNNLFDVRQFFTPPSTGSSYLTVNGVYPINQINTSGANFLSSGTIAFLEFIGGSGGGSAGNIPIVFDIEGALETGTSQSQPYLVTDSFSADYAYLYCETLGITGTTKATINKNGISIFTGSQTLDLPFNSTGTWVKLVPYYASYVEGDILTVNILQKANGVSNAKLAISPVTGTSGSGASLTVQETDGAPTVGSVTTINVPPGRLTNDGGGVVGLLIPYEIEYIQATGNVSVTATTEAGANLVLNGATGTYDGNPVIFEFFANNARPATDAADRSMSLWVYQDGASIGRIGFLSTPAAATTNTVVHGVRRFTPSAGQHHYQIRASVSGGTGLISAGGGRISENAPMFMRITRA